VASATAANSFCRLVEREAWEPVRHLFRATNPDLAADPDGYGFEGHPLRKDFPLTGFVELDTTD